MTKCSKDQTLAAVFITLAVLVSAALRIPGLFTDFWGDEIWSWWIAGQIHSLSGILLAEPARIDNNHPLNTLFLYLMGQNQPVWVYRLPALIAGVGTVILAARIMLRRGKAEAVIATLLFSFSYLLIFYSSEARGYSLVVFFSLLSFSLLQKSLGERAQEDHGMEILFGICCAMGFLSHLMFLNTYTAAFVWSLVRIRQLEPNTSLRFKRLLRLHAIPVIFVLLLFRFFVRDMVDGGAPPTSPAAVLIQTLSLALGGGSSGPLALVATLITVSLLLASLIYLTRERAAVWVFFLFAIVVAPAMICTRALFFNEHPQPLMPRYFLISVAMLLLCACPMIAHFWRKSPLWRVAVTCTLTLYTVGNLCSLKSFWVAGRGHYEQALTDIVNQTPATSAEQTIALASDNPIRTQLLIRFYASRVCSKRPITVTSDPQNWLIFNRFDARAAPAINYDGRPYLLSVIYPSGNLSGWTWWVYEAATRR